MTPVQKIIKNIALALAFFLIVSIISGILSVLYALSGVLGLKNENIKIDGTKISDDSKYGNGKNIIKIDGGIGNIDIEFNK